MRNINWTVYPFVPQAPPSQYSSLVDCFPCSDVEKDALRKFLDIANPNSDFVFHQKCEQMRSVVEEAFSTSRPRMSYRTKMTILNIIDSVFMMSFNLAEQCIISEIRESERNILYIADWCIQLKNDVISCGFCGSVKYLYADIVLSKSLKIHTITRLLTQRIVILRNNPHHSTTFHKTTHLKYFESLSLCPRLKDRATSSDRRLAIWACDNLCCLCLKRRISSDDYYSILDKCEHLFCHSCTKMWFEKS